MSNSYFQFKQFTIYQDQCAMKVCTDACVLGAWVSQKVSAYHSILDIGSGTGLLMMMMAQKTNADIHGIEIDHSSFQQSLENINQSNLGNQFRVFSGDVRTSVFEATYDFIICNPPFFENDLVSDTEKEQVAKHSKLLSLDELVKAIDENLETSGAFAVLLPYHRWNYFDEKATAKGFYLSEKLFLKQTAKHPRFRAILQYTRDRKDFVPEIELIIHQPDRTYTSPFVELMKEYYLKL